MKRYVDIVHLFPKHFARESEFLGSDCNRRHASRGIQSGFPEAVKVPTDSQLLHCPPHLRPPRLFRNTEMLITATWEANIYLITDFTFPALVNYISGQNYSPNCDHFSHYFTLHINGIIPQKQKATRVIIISPINRCCTVMCFNFEML